MRCDRDMSQGEIAIGNFVSEFLLVNTISKSFITLFDVMYES